ncbi:glycoside hydrolase family 78 protein [Flavicella sediminum]|uniref:glycoside hydrolase family 78 protein n=1 Tax=Flavicella sediminum TaxID=2585141 RepID=UPI001121F3F1|nr:fibronectin type III domain-containing protein [Flavicella sediminum]
MKHLLTVFIALFLCACGGEGTEEIKNTAPTKPENLSPTNNLACLTSDLDFSWNKSIDDQGDALTYFVEIATDNQFAQVVSSEETNATEKSFNLEKGKVYYWRVAAKDARGMQSAYSDTWTFYTEGEAVENHLPFMTENISPVPNAKVTSNSISLEWSCVDLDTDALLFDVYFGDTETPSLVSSDVENTTYDVSVDAEKMYYWRVDAKDGSGSITQGQLWSFETE